MECVYRVFLVSNLTSHPEGEKYNPILLFLFIKPYIQNFQLPFDRIKVHYKLEMLYLHWDIKKYKIKQNQIAYLFWLLANNASTVFTQINLNFKCFVCKH